MEDGLFTYLNGQAGITAIVGASPNQRIWPQVLPQNTALPALTMTVVSHTHEEHLTAAAGLAEAIVQIDCWATTYGGAKTLAAAVIAEMMGYTSAAGKMGTDDIRRVMLQNETDIYETTADGSGLGTHRVSQDYSIWHTESVPTF